MANNQFSSLQKELNEQGFGQSPTLDYRPDASRFGQGQWQVGETLYLSDGAQWFDLTSSKPIVPPAGFRLKDIPFNLKRAASGKISHDFSPRPYKIIATNTWYVDPVDGNDGTGAVNNPALPLKKLSVALAKAGMNAIKIINLTSDFVARGTDSWNNVGSAVTGSFTVEVVGPYRYFSCATASSSQDTFSAHATLANVYQVASTTANASSFVDILYKTNPTFTLPDNQSGPSSVLPHYTTYTKVASEAEVAATPGTFFCDNTNAFVRPIDDRNLTISANSATMVRCNNGTGFRLTPAAANVNIHVEGIDFIGGRPAYIVQTTANFTTVVSGAVDGISLLCSSTTGAAVGQVIRGTGIQAGTVITRIVTNTSITLSKPLIAAASGNYSTYYTGSVVVFEDCTFQGGGVSNGMNVAALCTVFLYKCGTYFNLNDNNNYHSPDSDAGVTQDTSPTWYEIECVTKGSGTTGSALTSDNDTTSHDLCQGVSVNCVYLGGDDRVIAAADLAHMWMLGCYVGQARTFGVGINSQSIAALTSAKLWMDTCFAETGNSPRWVAAGTGSLFHYNSGEVVNDVTSESTGPVVPYLG